MKYIKYLSNGCFLTIVMLVITVLSIVWINLSGQKENYVSDRTTSVLASFYPVYTIAENLLDDINDVTLSNLSEPQTGCLHDYTLTPEDMKQLSLSDIFVINGGGIEAFLPDVAANYPSVKIIDTGSDLPEYSGYPIDSNPHYWMSIPLYTDQVRTMSDGLVKELDSPGDSRILTKNTSDYISKLNDLKENADTIKPLLAGTDVILFHEAYEYIACDYDMNVRYLMDLDEERQVSAGEIADVTDIIKKYDIPLILAEETFGRDTAETVAAQTGIDVIYLDTIVRGKNDDNEDSYLKRMNDNILKLRKFANSDR